MIAAVLTWYFSSSHPPCALAPMSGKKKDKERQDTCIFNPEIKENGHCFSQRNIFKFVKIYSVHIFNEITEI